jgi:hypothetical protein
MTKRTDLEREVITLSAVWEQIGSLVHFSHFEQFDPAEPVFLRFKTTEASRLFLIILADLLSRPGREFDISVPKGTDARGGTYLGPLERVTLSPQFGGNVSALRASTAAFTTWLDGKVTVEKAWFPTIGRNGPFTVRRMDYLHMCGTATKHGVTRLDAIAKRIVAVFAENNTAITPSQSYLLIPEFQEWFQQNVFIASASIIAWHLNEIRWGIYRYLLTEFRRSFTRNPAKHELFYEYKVPEGLSDELVRTMYWELMNDMRQQPFFPRFTVTPFLTESF